MKRRALRILGWAVLLAPILLFLASAGHWFWEKRQREDYEATERWLENTVIPEIDWKDRPIGECIAWLNEWIEAAPGHPRGLHIVVASEEEANGLFHPYLATPSAHPQRPQAPSEAQITVRLSNIPVEEAIRYALSLAGMRFHTETRRILCSTKFSAGGTTDALVEKSVRISQWMASRIKTTGSGSETFQNWLIANGATFYEGCEVKLNSAGDKLFVRNTQEQIDLIETILSPGCAMGPPSWKDWPQIWFYQAKEWIAPSPPQQPSPPHYTIPELGIPTDGELAIPGLPKIE